VVGGCLSGSLTVTGFNRLDDRPDFLDGLLHPEQNTVTGVLRLHHEPEILGRRASLTRAECFAQRDHLGGEARSANCRASAPSRSARTSYSSAASCNDGTLTIAPLCGIVVTRPYAASSPIASLTVVRETPMPSVNSRSTRR
jgi:hypothetical protein